MEYLLLGLFVLIVVVFIRYEPTIDVVMSRDSYTILLWYNKTFNSPKTRTYKRLFEI